MHEAGVVIGRFQVHEMHAGHMALLTWVVERHAPRVLILVGVRPSPATLSNPMDYRTREGMLRTLFPEATILPVVDMGDNDAAWSRQVDQLVRTTFPTGSATLYGGRDSFIPHYSGSYPTRQLDLGADMTATDLRKALAATPINSPDFRAGVVYGIANLPPRTYLAVDVALVRRQRRSEAVGGFSQAPSHEVWLGRKTTEIGVRFPGGHVDPADESCAQAAVRELREETGIVSEQPLTFIGDFRIDDWRTRDAADAYYRSLFYVAEYTFGAARASDDLHAGDWFPLTEGIPIVPEHRVLLTALRRHLGYFESTPHGGPHAG